MLPADGSPRRGERHEGLQPPVPPPTRPRDTDEAIARQIGEWQTRLLQLNRRNRLLYFKPGRSAVGITGIGPDELEDRLVRSRVGLAFPYVPPARRGRHRTFNVAEEPDDDDETQVRQGDLKTDCEPADLQRRLRNLRQRDREWHEEQGINVLFLAAGFLDWVDADGERACSPLVLIPCDLERSSPRDPYRLRREDDDRVVNPTLRHQLGQFRVEIPELAEESGGTEESVEQYLLEMGDLVASRRGWSVDHRIVLGTFSYSKLAMYEDLTRMRERGVRSELTRLLAGGDTAPAVGSDGATSAMPSAPELAGGRLDDVLDVRDQYTVLSADFSQLSAIETARKGDNLVVHGPPGTGKSQTIANLIATLLVDGKHVLFVSEKTAALDVVKRRLEECRLDVFCLDLHSDRGRKSEVYSQLRSALDDSREKVAEHISVDELIECRHELNRLVRLLHEVRLPLEQSVYAVQGRVARLAHLARFEGFEVPPAAELTLEWVRNARSAAERIERRPEEFRSHEESRWRPLRTSLKALQLPELIRDDTSTVQNAVVSLREKVDPHTEWLGVASIGSAEDACTAYRLLGLLAAAPGVPVDWLRRDVVPRLRTLAQEQSKQQRVRQQHEGELDGWCSGEVPDIDYRAAAGAVVVLPDEQEAVETTVGARWRKVIAADPEVLVNAVDDLATALDSLVATDRDVSGLLAGSDSRTLGGIEEMSKQAAAIIRLDPVPERWLAGPAIREVERRLQEARSQFETLVQSETCLYENFEDVLIEQVDEEMMIRYRTDYQGLWQRKLGGTYRKDRRTVRGQLREPRKLSLDEERKAVQLALDVKRRRGEWHRMEPDYSEMLGERFEGRETPWDAVSADVGALCSVLTDWRGDATILRELTSAEAVGERRRALKSAVPELEDSLDRYLQAAAELDHERLNNSELEVEVTLRAVRGALDPLRRISEGTAELYSRLGRLPGDFDELAELIDRGVRLIAIREEDERLAPTLTEDFGRFFARQDTDWGAVVKALDWTSEFLDAGPRLSESLRGHATDPRPSDEYRVRAESVHMAAEEFSDALNVLDQRFDRNLMPWRSWDRASLPDLQAWASDLHDHADEAPSWVDYQGAVRNFDGLLGSGTAGEIRDLTERAEDVPGIVERRIYVAWLEEIYTSEPELQRFTSVDHEEVRRRFRALDEGFVQAARQRVRERVFEKYPDQYATPLQAGQLATLRGELSKRRRQMPVRRLIQRVPNVMQALKPCFLMSPLAVSQYLPGGLLESDNLQFDTVIFDEASQVLPEDALPAMERARQVIVVGDQRQLPPTTFFQGGLDDDSDDDESEDSFEGRESILDVMVGQVGAGIAERYLLMHYRSRCESLIRFSNRQFYEDRLITFPGPHSAASAVRDVYLRDAIYDAGGSRTNRAEADRVTEEVFYLMKARPIQESIGVVALSRPQAELIEHLIEHRRLDNRQHDDRFREDCPERFFVKNLENVQGDERDHVILSIGYGPTAAGAVPNRFGPINQEGGERRLNVAVTRARRSMTVVHSLPPEDITSGSTGARQLRRYLEYVRNPERAFEAEVTGTGEPESPFEEAVLAALRGRGHRVEAQIGISGYRIDLAIGSKDGERFDLGIECDGVTYHRSPAARDRDWLRQQILEGLGWHIHRVWSTAWTRDPQTEIAAIEQALERARAGRPEPLPATAGSDRGDPAEPSPPTPAPEGPPEAAPAGPTRSQLFEEYLSFECQSRPVSGTPSFGPHLITLVRDIVLVEQPVSVQTVTDRVRVAHGVSRAGSQVRRTIRDAIRQAIANGYIRREDCDDGFLCGSDDSGPRHPRRAGDRAIGRIAYSEVDEALLLVARKAFGATREDLVQDTARQFGYRRTGLDIQDRLSSGVERLLASGRLVRQGDMLVAAESGSAE